MIKNGNGEHESSSADGTLQCPICGKSRIRTTPTEDPFRYGTGKEAVELTVVVPVRSCVDCGYQFLDEEAEDIRHEAVCRHLGVLTPSEILALRRRYDVTRMQFAEITRLGEATLGRWERGALIQNAAYDQLLYLLSFEENFERLRERVNQRAEIVTENVVSEPSGG
jgi:putative zinc finger/helix-turn-helix YgiT family protein